jgi:hypothetical protein
MLLQASKKVGLEVNVGKCARFVSMSPHQHVRQNFTLILIQKLSIFFYNLAKFKYLETTNKSELRTYNLGHNAV